MQRENGRCEKLAPKTGDRCVCRERGGGREVGWPSQVTRAVTGASFCLPGELPPLCRSPLPNLWSVPRSAAPSMMVLRGPAVATAGCTPAGLARAGRPAPLPSMSGHRRAPTGGRCVRRGEGVHDVGVVRTLRSAPHTSPSPDARTSHQARRRPIAPGPAQRKGQRMPSCPFRPLTLCPKPSLNLAAPPPSPHPPPPPTRPSPPPSGGTPTRPCPTCARSRAWTRCWASSRRPGTRW